MALNEISIFTKAVGTMDTLAARMQKVKGVECSGRRMK